jgi:hypothetical protein
VHVAVPPDFLAPKPAEDPTRAAHLATVGDDALSRYYAAYWKGRGEGLQPQAMGIDEPVQSMSHRGGEVLHPPPKHLPSDEL